MLPVVFPAAMVSVVPACVKSAASVPAPAAADTVTVTASVAPLDITAVTLATPPYSEIGFADSLRVGSLDE